MIWPAPPSLTLSPTHPSSFTHLFTQLAVSPLLKQPQESRDLFCLTYHHIPECSQQAHKLPGAKLMFTRYRLTKRMKAKPTSGAATGKGKGGLKDTILHSC